MHIAQLKWSGILLWGLLGCGSCASDNARNAAAGGNAGPTTGGGSSGSGHASANGGSSMGGAATVADSGSEAARGGGGDGAQPVEAGPGAVAPSAESGTGVDGGAASARADAAAEAAGAGAGSVADSGRPSDGSTRVADAESGTAPMSSDAAAMAGVRIVGRTAPGTAGRVRFAWSGTSIVARFSGTQVAIQLNDGSNRNEFEIVVDGMRLPKLVTAAGMTTYPIASGLPDGTHELVVWRRTEASYNATEFIGLTGFSAGGGLLAPPPASERRIEVIGDSFTAGYGIEGTDPCTATASNENNYVAYSSVAARTLGADLLTVAWSGIGMYRNYNEATPLTPTMPQRYDYAIPTDTTTLWDFSKFQPQAVVINLSTNDYSTRGDPGQPFVDAYLSFIGRVRAHYPSAYIICIIQWSTSNARINQVVDAVKAAGDTRILSFDLRPVSNGLGCSGHPDVAAGLTMGASLAAEIRRVLDW